MNSKQAVAGRYIPTTRHDLAPGQPEDHHHHSHRLKTPLPFRIHEPRLATMPDTSTRTVHNFPVPASFRSSTLVFSLNSTKIVLDNPDPEVTLLEFIRAQGFTGTKLGCNEGELRSTPEYGIKVGRAMLIRSFGLGQAVVEPAQLSSASSNPPPSPPLLPLPPNHPSARVTAQ